MQKLTFTSGTFMRVPSLPTKMSSISTRRYRSRDIESLFPVRKATASTNTSLCSQNTKLLPNRTLWMPSWSPRSCTTDGSRAAFCPIDATLSADWVLASNTGSYVEWLDWKTVQSSPGRGPGRGCPDRVMKSKGDLELTMQSFKPKLEWRKRGKPFSCALSRLFSLAWQKQEREREITKIHQDTNVLDAIPSFFNSCEKKGNVRATQTWRHLAAFTCATLRGVGRSCHTSAPL